MLSSEILDNMLNQNFPKKKKKKNENRSFTNIFEQKDT